MEDMLQLGGNIELSGFGRLDSGVMVVLKKIVGTYARKMSDYVENFEKLSLNVKPVHAKEKGEIYELNARMIAAGRVIASETSDRNLFVAVDDSLKKIMNQISK